MKFERCYISPHTEDELRAACRKYTSGDDIERAVANLMAHERRVEHYRNDTYHVALDKEHEHGMGAMRVWHLSIKRHDRRPVHDWRKLQAIKTAIVGPNVEAVELYPAEDRVVDTANQYHLYAFPDMVALPFGFPTGMRTDAPEFGKAQQRPGSKPK